MRLILMSTITLGTILVFGSPTADAATPDQIDETFTLRAYPGRWILPAEGDSLIIPRVQLNDLAGDVWEVVVLKNGRRGCVIASQAIFTEMHIDFASPWGTPKGKHLLNLQLNSVGTEALSIYSAQQENIGQPIAFKYNDRWIGFPQLQTHLRHGGTVVLGLTEEEIAAITGASQSR